MKKVLSSLLAFVVASSMLCGVSYASNELSYYENEEIVLEYLITEECSNRLTISGGTATCNSSAIGKPEVTSISATQTLEKQGFLWSWSSVSGASWTKTVSGNLLSLEKQKSGLTSGTYRLRTVFTLTSSNGLTETVTIYSNEVTI